MKQKPFIFDKLIFSAFSLLLLLSLQSCNLFKPSNIDKEFYKEKMLLKWHAELTVNSPYFILNDPKKNNELFNFDTLLNEKITFFIFIPSSACNSCFNDIYEYIIYELALRKKEVIIVCDESNIRQTLFLFPDNLVLSMKSLDNIEVSVGKNFFISPFMFVYKSNKMLGSFILEKNRNDLVKTYIDFWILSN